MKLLLCYGPTPVLNVNFSKSASTICLRSTRLVNLARWDFPFLGQPMREHYHGSSGKKLKHPVVNTLIARAEIIDAVSQEVGLWPAVARVPAPLSGQSARVHLHGQFVKPFQKGH